MGESLLYGLLKAVLVRVTHMGYEGRKQIFYCDWLLQLGCTMI